MKVSSYYALCALCAFLFFVSHAPAQTRGWGANNKGALGIGNTTDQPAPQAVGALPDATAVSGGIDHTLFLRADGTLFA
ncbi:MAG TPA: RCC1 domain-containing protein, partial [Pyrinomonadaceae bacterium]